MPASERQILANHRNAQRSTGPRTPEGKRAVARNAIAHGILARDIVAGQYEHVEDFESLLAALTDDLQPSGALEELLVAEIAGLAWRRRRVLRAEAGSIAVSIDAAHSQARSDYAEKFAEARDLIARIDGDDGRLAAVLSGKARAILNRSPAGLTCLLHAIQTARHDLETSDLPSSWYVRLIHLVGPDSDAGRLARDLAGSSDPAASPDLPSLRAALATQSLAITTRLKDQHEAADSAAIHLDAQLSLPVGSDADRILRYDKTLTNALYRALTELESLRSARTVSSPTA